MSGFRSLFIESRCKCNYSNGYLVVITKENTVKIHLSEISSLVFSTQHVSITAYLLAELAKAKINVVFCDEKHNPVSQSIPIHGAFNCPERLQEQLSWSGPAKKQVWKKIVQDKIRAQARVLSLCNLKESSTILLNYANDVHSADTTNREAAAACTYFASLFGTSFSRDLNCDINAALNYGYDILLSQVNREIAALGYETSLGINHHGSLNQWNLSCDFMEPFRPFFDWIFLSPDDWLFSRETKLSMANALNSHVSFDGGNYLMSSVIRKYIKSCTRALSKEIQAIEITSYDFK